MSSKIVNLERGRPTAERAMILLSQELRIAKVNRSRALKIIHGYGSTGKGGAIRAAAHRLLAQRRAGGQIRDYVRGEDFSPMTNAGRAAAAAVPELKKDCDFGRGNDGITIVLF